MLLEELRQCGRHDTLKEQLAFYLSSQTVDDLYERVLERLENDGSGEAVRKVMTALWASRAGLTEPELLAITGSQAAAVGTDRPGTGEGIRPQRQPAGV